MKRILPALLLLAMAACERKGFVGAIMDGRRPVSWRDTQREDDRAFRFVCSLCGTTASPGGGTCQLNSCMAMLTALASYTCPNCGGDGACVACKYYGQEGQQCYWCGGSTWTADGVACVHCHEGRTCRVCANAPGQCDVCGGDGLLTMADMQARAGGGGMPAPQPQPQPTQPEQPEPPEGR